MKKNTRAIALALLCALLAGCVTINGWQWFALASTKDLRIGMTLDEVKTIMPYPTKINTTRTANSVHEQIIWRGQRSQYYHPPTIYLYFANGILTAWQEN